MKEFSIALWGATGFTGKLTAVALARQYGKSKELKKIALVGRTFRKLEAVAEDMRKEASEIPLEIIVLQVRGKSLDSDAEIFKTELCSKADVVLALAGPFSEIGEPLVKACAETGTDYCDITGEMSWVSKMQQRYSEAAIRSGARIIHCCGFDYLLNDIGVYSVVRKTAGMGELAVEQVVEAPGVTISGGTLRSLIGAFKKMSLREVLTLGSDPYVYAGVSELPKAAEAAKSDNKSKKTPHFNETLQRWTAPGVMTNGMTSFMHWSNLSANARYGPGFRFRVADAASSYLNAAMKSTIPWFIMTLVLILSRLPSSWVDRLLPQPGNGKPLSELQRDYFVKVTTAKQAEPSTKHQITFTKGEGYMMTAYGVIACGFAAYRQRKDAKGKVFGGVGPATALLDFDYLEKELIRNSAFTIEN